MASTYSTDLKLELMATGENAGTWGTKTNTNLNLIQQAIAGYQAIDVASGDIALAMTDASISNGRNMILKFTGTLAGTRIVTVPDGIEKFYIVEDGSTHGAYTLTFKTVSGTGFQLTEGKISACFSDGTNITEVALNTLNGTIGTAQIDNSAVTTAKLAASSITESKMSTNVIAAGAIKDDAVTTTKILNDAVTAAKLQRKFTISTSSPTGGSDGDLWFTYS